MRKTNNTNASEQFNVSGGGTKHTAIVAGLIALTVGAGFFLLGRMHGQKLVQASSIAENRLYQAEVDRQQQHLQGLEKRVEAGLNGLSLKLGQLQAQMLRLNALGQQVATAAKLDEADFNFSADVPQGGLEITSDEVESQTVDSLQSQIQSLSKQMEERRWQLDVLENVLVSKNLNHDFMPQGKPVVSGWLSSNYGWRNDPFSGRRAFHHGVDFAGQKGGDVVAVASGLVTIAKRRGGYGLLIEIDHGGGYVTRYGHNQEAMVSPGDLVSRGDIIGKIGSSGRSTGPHVHYEVLRDGKSVNPYNYIKSASN